MLSPRRLVHCLVLCLVLPLWWGAHPDASLAHGPARVAVLGPAPANCPPAPAPQSFAPKVFGPGVGGAPVWAVFGGQSAVLPGEPHSTVSPPHTRDGWQMKILWALAPATTDTVTLRGWNLSTGKRVVFGLSDVAGNGTVGMLDPRSGGGNPDGWGGFPSDEYFPSAGCYVLFAQWRTGSWIVPFAFGR